MKKYLVFFLTFFLFNFSASATHIMGGEITWTCLKVGPDVGKYVFQMNRKYSFKKHWLTKTLAL